jgi:hypothetical protein
MTVITTPVYPPINSRDHDWSAHFEGQEECPDAYGWGDSEAAALMDLLNNTDEDSK